MVVSKKFSALKSPQEAIVHHPIVICGLGSSVAHLLKPEHICLLFLIKKRDIKLDPRVSADWAFPLLCNTLTHRLPLPPQHSCPPVISPPLHTHFLLSFYHCPLLLCWVYYRVWCLHVCALQGMTLFLDIDWSRCCSSETQSSHFLFCS